jgi:hypothetical protein
MLYDDPVTSPMQTGPAKGCDVRLAIVLDGVSENWQNNVLPILGRPTIATIDIDGIGAVDAPAILLSKDQARHLATLITEILGPEDGNHVREFASFSHCSSR